MSGPAQDQPTGAGESTLDRDVALLFATRCLRMFGYGFLSTVLVLYLTSLGLLRRRCRAAAGADAPGRRGDLAVADDPRRPDRPAARPARGRCPDARGGPRVRGHARVRGAGGRGDDRRHQPQRQRGRPVPGRRAGVARASWSPADAGRSVFARYQLVGSFATAIGALVAGAIAQLAIDRRRVPSRRVSAGHRRLRAGRASSWRSCSCGSVPAHRGAAARRPGRAHPDAPRAASLAARRGQPVGAVRARRVRGRLRHRELHRASGSRSGSGSTRRPSGCCCSGPTSWRVSRRSPPARSRRASGSSTRWCSRTCRRTCC